ncbi:MAG: efflux RND transporter periplasmic adaptor subunit [Zavarzinella sp.]|nr:efflux RND transporter periplasmic adaptor subunit [Zavarzinella sp.]
MRRLIRWGIILGILGTIGWAVAVPGMAYMKERRRVTYREDAVSRGRIVAVVNSTGTVKPVLSVAVGSFVSGPIEKIYVDFNDEVKKGQVMAQIDPQIYKANVARDKAVLATRKADVDRVKAELQQAKNDESRAKALQAENTTFISAAEMDQFKFKRMSLEAQLAVADANVLQAQANLDQSEANLKYTEITAPADGVIIDRKVDPGQTVAASFQTPELFVLAPDMRKEMRVFASVDEADIGLIREAQRIGLPVRFTVDAYPDDLFSGTIFQIRRNSTTNQNVVTYPVVVSAPNSDLKLLPGMTASISFQVGERADVLRVPNAALRFYPQREQVRPEDRPILEGVVAAAGKPEDEDERERLEATKSAEEKAELRRQRNRRHVWVLDGEFLRAVGVTTGLADGNNTELLSGDLKQGQKLVTGIQPKQ